MAFRSRDEEGDKDVYPDSEAWQVPQSNGLPWKYVIAGPVDTFEHDEQPYHERPEEDVVERDG